jgi:hypothetical protein
MRNPYNRGRLEFAEERIADLSRRIVEMDAVGTADFAGLVLWAGTPHRILKLAPTE